MIKEIQEEIVEAIEEAYNAAYDADYIAYILLIGRAELLPGMKKLTGTDCIMECMEDIYYDETRTQYYLDYLGRNYSKEGYNYPDDVAISDITTELTIYSHIWDSMYFMKSLYRIAAIISRKGYLWQSVLPTKEIHLHFKLNVIDPLKAAGLKLGTILEQAYKSSIRNAFAHSNFIIDKEGRRIDIRPRTGYETYSFLEFQKIFLNAVILMNKMENYQEANHNVAAKKNTALTEAFLTPDGLKVQVYGKMVRRGEAIYPEFQMVKIID